MDGLQKLLLIEELRSVLRERQQQQTSQAGTADDARPTTSTNRQCRRCRRHLPSHLFNEQDGQVDIC